MSNLKEYHIDLPLFRKSLIIRTSSIFSINLLLLLWTVWAAPKESILNYLGICSLLLIAIGLFLNQNLKRQINILKNNYLEVNNNILQWYTGNGQCTTINLKRVKKIERDKFRGFDRFLLFEGDTIHTILNLKESDRFQTEIESKTNLKVEIFIYNWMQNLMKAFAFFFPAIISLVLTSLQFLELRIFFLALTVNSIFFFYQFSEKRTRTGFSDATIRRSLIILFSLLAYQLMLLFN